MEVEDAEGSSEELEIKSEVKAEGNDSQTKIKTEKESKPGIIYLSTVPPGMNVKQIRDYFTEFGPINRSFLQPEKKAWKVKGKIKNQTFTEGWIEFRKRRHAKMVAETLNNKPVGGKKRKIYHDFLWNIKYLPGFQWVHLNERLAYERISLKAKMRAEISAVKRETNFFSKSIDLSKRLKKKGIISTPSDKEKEETEAISTVAPSSYTPQLVSKKPIKDRGEFFKSIFNKNKS